MVTSHYYEIDKPNWTGGLIYDEILFFSGTVLSNTVHVHDPMHLLLTLHLTKRVYWAMLMKQDNIFYQPQFVLLTPGWRNLKNRRKAENSELWILWRVQG